MNQANLNDYYKRSGDDYLLNGETEENEHGFCVWMVKGKTLILNNVYGDGIYWNQWAEDKAKELGLDKIFFATKRNPQGFIRRHGFSLIGYILERQL